MPELNFEELLNSKATAYNTPRHISTEQERVVWEAQCEALYNMLVGNVKPGRSIGLKEAITTRDFPILLKTVIDERILMPIEPDYIGQSLLATTIQVGSQYGSYRIPSFGYLTAGEVGEQQEYPEGFSQINKDNVVTIPIRKFGIRVGVTEEVMQSDELGLFGMYILGAKLAMNRLKEEQIFSLFKNVVMPVFDNTVAWGPDFIDTVDISTINSGVPYDTKYNTNGRGSDGNFNGTLHIFDVIDTMAAVLARNHTPTDMLVNPLGWAILARNPILNGFYNNMRATPQQMMQAPQFQAKGPGDFPAIPMPWAMTLHVTPFVPVDFTNTGSAPFVTDIYIGSRQNGILLLQGSPLAQDSWQNFERDVLNVRLREFYGIGLADMGRSWAAIKNVRIDSSYEYVVTKLVG